MRSILFLILLVLCMNVSAQRWAKIEGTEIEFSHFINPNRDNWNRVHYEYFRKDQKVIGVTKGLAEEFYVMLQETPLAFDSIFNNLRLKTSSSYDTVRNHFDSSILKIDYKEAAIIEGWKVIYGYKEIIWQLKNYTWSRFNFSSCITHIVFNRKKNPDHKFYNLVFVAAMFDGCTL